MCSVLKDLVSNHRPMCPVLAQLPTLHSTSSPQQRRILWFRGYIAQVFLSQLACPSLSLSARPGIYPCMSVLTSCVESVALINMQCASSL